MSDNPKSDSLLLGAIGTTGSVETPVTCQIVTHPVFSSKIASFVVGIVDEDGNATTLPLTSIRGIEVPGAQLRRGVHTPFGIGHLSAPAKDSLDWLIDQVAPDG